MDKKINITKIPVLYINLDDRRDRKEKTESLLKKYGFENFERFPASKLSGRSIGCSTSHSRALQHIIKENIYPCLILEDDVEIFDFREKIPCPKNADAMYLGISRYGFNHDLNEPHPRSLKIKELSKHYHRIHNMLARHAIIHFNPDYDQACIDQMNKFFAEPEKYVAGDASLTEINPKWKVYVQNIPTFYQSEQGTRGLTKHSIYSCNFVEMDKL